MPYVSVDETRRCESCGGPITPKNRTGICTRNKACRSALQQRINGKLAEQTEDTPDNCPWLLPDAWELSELDDECSEERIYALDEFGHRIPIVDEIAIDIAVEGRRHVGLTQIEREEVVRRMVLGSWGVNDIAHHCGTTRKRLDPIFNKLGYEVVPHIKPNGKRGRANIRPIREAVNG